MAVGKKKAIRDFTQGNPTKELLMFSLPIACTLILQSFYNMADTLIIGNFVGDTAMGAVGTAGTVSSVLLMLVYGLSTGMGVVVSQFIGAKDYKNVKKSMMTAMYIVIGVSLLMTVIGISFSPAILRMIQMVVENAHKAGIWAGICGELGADQELTKEFLAMGVDELSVSPGSILPLRKIILETNVAEYKAGKKC